MTGFRQMQNLHAYSGGTVRDSHPVFYSLAVLLPHPQALKRNIYLQQQYTRIHGKCQSKKGKTIINETNRNIIGKLFPLIIINVPLHSGEGVQLL